MKAKYFILTLIASLAALTGCQKETSTFLDEVKVSSSYVSVPGDGGSVAITVDACSDWSIASDAEWLTVSPLSGSAGETTLTFTAAAAEATRETTIFLQCGGATQRINVIQMTEAVEPPTLTVSEAIAIGYAIADGKASEQTIRVKGIVCRIDEISTSYGNATYYLSEDGTYSGSHGSRDANWFEVYRGYWIDGAKFTKGDEFAIGDELVVQGVIISYNGIPETNQGTAEVISIKKSLIGIDGTELLGAEEGEGVTEFPLEGGSIKVGVNTKGDGFHVVIPAEAKSWLHIEDFGSNYVTLAADANMGGDRSVSVSFTTEADGTTYSCEQSFTQKGSIVVATVAEFLAAPTGTSQYRVTGVVTREYASDAQGQSFYVKDWSGEVLVYRLNDYKASGAKVGDIITVVGQRGEYNGTAQLTGGVYESHIPVTEVTASEFLARPDSKDVYYMVTGTVTNIAKADYGNLYISDGTGEVYVYGCYPGYGATGDNRMGFLAAAGIEVGDTLTMIGYKDTYNGTVELCGGIYFSHEKAK